MCKYLPIPEIPTTRITPHYLPFGKCFVCGENVYKIIDYHILICSTECKQLYKLNNNE